MMFEKNEFDEFFGEIVDIGTHDFNVPDRIFYYTGCIKEITGNYIKLKTATGYKIVELDQIVEIRLSKREVVK